MRRAGLRGAAGLGAVERLALEQTARDTVPRVIAAHAQQELTGDSPTDCDRLDQALDALEADGILVRENFTCCQFCGNVEFGTKLTVPGTLVTR